MSWILIDDSSVNGSCIGVDSGASAHLCCFGIFGAVLCEFLCYFLRVGHASALTLRFGLLVLSHDFDQL